MSEKISKHFHLTLHFTVTGDESKIPTTGVKYQSSPNATRGGDDAWWHKHDDRLRLLYKAVIANDKTLTNFLASCIASWLETETYQLWYTLFFDDDMLEDRNDVNMGKLLQPAIATLSEEDKSTFESMVADDVLFENIEEFIDCFSTDLTGVDFTEVEMRDHQ